MPTTPNARRRKVRCPKCTALFSEPAKPIFECPICSCCLSANGVIALTTSLSSQAKEREFGPTKDVNGRDEVAGVQNQEGFSRDGSETQRDTHAHTKGSEENKTQIHKEEQLPPITLSEDLHVVQNQEGYSRGRSGTQQDTHTCTEVSEENKTQVHIEEQPPPITQNEEHHGNFEKDGKEAKSSVDGTFEEDVSGEKDNAPKDSSSLASNLAVGNNEVLEGDDTVGKGSARNKRLDLEMFRTTRCELSFKYSIEGAQPVESNNDGKGLPLSKFSSPVPNAEVPAVPLPTPLRVKISNRCEESSDQSEHGRYSFSSDTVSHDGSESDFDFPAPWADSMQDKVLLDSSGKKELVLLHAKQTASSMPHQLELWDVDAANGNEEYASQESGKHSEKFDPKLPLTVDAAFNVASQSRKENDLRGSGETSSFDHSSQVNDPASIISSDDKNLVKPSVATISSNLQDAQFALNLQNISSVDESQSAFHKGSSRDDIQAIDLGGVLDSEEMISSGMTNGNPSSVILGPLGNGLLLDHTYIDTLARRDEDLYDHHLLQDKEREHDLYSHQEVDEWQHGQGNDSPSNDCYYATIMESENHRQDLQQMEKQSRLLADHAASNSPLPISQPCVIPSHHVSDHLSFGASSSDQMYSYQVPVQPLLLPTTLQDHSLAAPFVYHGAPNSCMVCPNQYPCMQTHCGPHCAVCVSHSGCITWNSGHADYWSCHQAPCGPAPAFTSSLGAYNQGPTNLKQRYDSPNADLRLQAQAYLSGKLSQYPPLPKDGASPYFSCKGCSRVLQVPLDLPPTHGFVQKLRCSACSRVNKFSAKDLIRLRQQVVASSPFMQLTSTVRVINQLPLNVPNVSLDNQHVLEMPSWQHEATSSKTMYQVDASVLASRVSPLSSQGGDSLGSKPIDHDIDRSINKGPQYIKSTSSANSVTTSADHSESGSIDNVRFERRRQDAVVSSRHVAVDEKDEGLDFGAPRISDGDSLDQSESRMRSPENIQAQGTHDVVPEPIPLRGQDAKLDRIEQPNREAKGKKPGSPLLVLLNQESTRFSISLDPRSEEFKSTSWSPASELPLINQSHLQRKERASSQSRKGPKYIAGLLRRSLKDFSKGGAIGDTNK